MQEDPWPRQQKGLGTWGFFGFLASGSDALQRACGPQRAFSSTPARR